MMLTLRRCRWLLAAPIAIVVLSGLLVDARGPYSLGLNHDPDYCYLLNSLSILMFHAPGLVEHPGTTAQILGSAAMFGKWIGASLAGKWVPLQEAVLANPEEYLHFLNFVFVLLIAGGVFYAGCRMYRMSDSLAAAIVLQLTIFQFRECLVALTRVDPEPVLIAVAFALMVPLVSLLLGKEPQALRAAIFSGAIVGLGLITKITFVPYLAVSGLLNGWRQELRFAIACLVSAFIAALPIFSSLPAAARWIGSLAIHSGAYGSGPSRLPTPAQLVANFKLIYAAEPFLFYWFIYYSAVLIAVYFAPRAFEHRLAQSIKRLLWVSLAVIGIQVAMATKHFVAPRYILPALVFTAVLNSFLVLLYASNSHVHYLKQVLALVGAALFVVSCCTNAPRVKLWATEARKYQADAAQLEEQRRKLGDCVTIGYYSTGADHYPLQLASGFTRGVHSAMLTKLYSDLIFYDGNFVSFSHESRQSQVRQLLAEGRCVLMEGWPMSADSPNLPPGYTLEKVTKGAHEGIYKLVPKESDNVPTSGITIEAEEYTAGTVATDGWAFGAGIGEIVSPKHSEYAEYRFPISSGGSYALWIRYASAEARPLTLTINGQLITKLACAGVTGGWDPDDQRVERIAAVNLMTGLNTLRLESTGAFPIIDKFLFAPVAERK